jgi:pre-rRNA-processing protein TSR1
MNHSHRSTQKQANKPFKSKHASKGSIKKENKGKINRTSVKQSHSMIQKQDKRNQQKQLQKNKRLDSLQHARLFNGLSSAPKETVVVPLCSDVDTVQVIKNLFDAMEHELVFENGAYMMTAEKYKQRIRFIPTKRDLLQVIDATKIADRVIFILSSNEEVDSFGERLMSAVKIQGVPDVICMVQHLEQIPTKKQTDVRKSLLYYMSHHFPGELKLYSQGNITECVNCIRQITSQNPKGIIWRDRHPYITAESCDFIPHDTDDKLGTLKVTGFVRGNNLSANRLVHIPGYGDFQVSRIVAAPILKHDEMQMEEQVLHEADPELQDSLVDQNIPDPMEGEQTWPTEEELAAAEERVKNKEHENMEMPFGQPKKKRVPKGTSAYQAAWILEDDEDGEEVGSDEEMAVEPPLDKSDDEEPEEYEEIELENRSIHFDELDENENEKQ